MEAIKAIVSYVTDYITKPMLKSHQIFSAAYDIYQKNIHLADTKNNCIQSARKLLMKLANNITSKLEIGSPMACMYLLGNPDHYTSHEFVSFWWCSYFNTVQRDYEMNYNVTNELLDALHISENLQLNTTNNPTSSVDDYIYRPEKLENISPYDWIRYSEKKSIPKRKRRI
ncbi:hypothetical protein FA15DRAFT_604526 [Coprinopsis marcescibilis]|uniref:Uncharacterized protein n=1 Tax=Coprinopsis marcescibilis TaxID=230819 RepID=A0A5C3KCB7_COPMA|nr:hypothetical protein FA15DRAFT_604526 [Coprinopsis marcescibilis]